MVLIDANCDDSSHGIAHFSKIQLNVWYFMYYCETVGGLTVLYFDASELLNIMIRMDVYIKQARFHLLNSFNRENCFENYR